VAGRAPEALTGCYGIDRPGSPEIGMMLIARAFAGLAFLLAMIGATLFLAAGDMRYGQAWTFLAVFGVAVLTITVYLMAKDRTLLERRVVAGPLAEKQAAQKLIQWIAVLAFITVFAVSGLDHRFGWTRVATSLVITGHVLVAAGLLIVFLVFKENTFTSGTIEVARDQRVISTGPYRIVRHPMYAGAIIMLAGAPLALGSLTALLPVGLLAAVIVGRLLDEERFLARNLRGYDEYRIRVRKRLVPLLW
jgi:protein-S-isoprenylcysteine O-methyltransferase Ste14